MSLSIKNFFRFYIFNYNSKDLTPKQQKDAKIGSILLGVFSIGIVHLICRLALYDKKFTVKKGSDTPEAAKVAKRILSNKVQPLPVTQHLNAINPKDLNPQKIMKDASNSQSDDDSARALEEERIRHATDKKKIEDAFKANQLKTQREAEERKKFLEHSEEELRKSREASVHAVNNYIKTKMEFDEKFNPLVSGSNAFENRDIKNVPPYPKLEPLLGKEIRYPEKTSDDIKITLNNRLAFLDKEIQFYTRVSILKLNMSALVIESCVPWNMSYLPYILMMDDELCIIKVSDLAKNDWIKLLGYCGDRILKLSSELTRKVSLQNKDLTKLLLIEIPHLTADELNLFADNLPAYVFQIINKDEVSKLNLNKLSDEQLQYLILCKGAVQEIENENLIALIKRIKKHQGFLDLKDSQMEYLLDHLDPVDLTIPLFAAIFDSRKSKTTQLLRKLELGEKFYAFQSFFSIEHFALLTDDQILQLDFEKLGDKKQQQTIFDKVYGYIYSDEKIRTKKLLASLPIDAKFYAFQSFFSIEHFALLTDDQILQLDFEKLGDKKQQQTIFDKVYGYVYSDEKIRTKKLLASLPIDAKFYAFQSFFSIEHFALLTDDQILQLDFEKLGNKKQQQTIFDKVYGYIYSDEKIRTKKLLADLPIEAKFYAFQSFFSIEHFAMLTDDQVLQLDFEKLGDKKRQQTIFNKVYSLFSSDLERTKKLLADLPIEAKFYAFQSFFSIEHFAMLTDDQVLQLDFEKLGEKKKQKAIFDKVFNVYDTERTSPLLEKISFDKSFYYLQNLFSERHWQLLSDSKILKTDSSKITNKKLFCDAIFSQEARAMALLSQFTKEQIEPLKSHLDRYKKYLED